MVPRILIAGLAVFSLVISSNYQAASSVNEDEQWLTPQRTETGFQGIIVSDIVNSFQLYSRLEAQSDTPAPGSTFLCSSSSSENCSSAKTFIYNSVIGPCNEINQENCISSLQSIDANGKKSEAIFDSLVYPNHINLYKGDPLIGIPEPSEPSIWEIPGAPHIGGIKYAVVSGLSGEIKGKRPTPPSDFYAYVIPVEEVETGFSGYEGDEFASTYPQCVQKSLGANGEARVGCRGAFDSGIGKDFRKCVLMVDKQPSCYVQRPFPLNKDFQLEIRLKDKLNGWMHGRLTNPNIAIREEPNKSITLSISGKPIKVPIFYHGDLFKNLPKKLQDAYRNRPGLSAGGFYCRVSCDQLTDATKRNSNSTPWSFGEDSIEEMKLWLELSGDKSVAAPSMWSARTISAISLTGSPECFSRGVDLKGLVTTNSTTYSDGPPSFTEGELRYRVSSPHFLANGDIFRGDYNLVIRNDVASCLYGFNNQPIRATVSITKPDGLSDNISTEIVASRNGWLYLSAKNFTFSDPLIRIKLSQNNEKFSSNKTKAVLKKVLIKCTNGKVIKKINGLNPKCPKGYKKIN